MRILFSPCSSLFDEDTNVYQKKEEGPINEPVLVRLNASNGAVVEQWGEGWFYLPHGLTIDKDINYWMTDVAMHQVSQQICTVYLSLSLHFTAK